MKATARLASFTANPPPWPDDARHGAARAFADTIGCALAGAHDPATLATARSVAAWGDGAARLIGGSSRAPAPFAALVNATAAHALDYDDVLEPPLAHVSAVLVPALLALSEERGASGEDLIGAYLVGFEIMARLGEGMNLVHYARGWHTTSTLGAPAAAGACARLLDLDEARTHHALSLATSFAQGSKAQFGSHAKPLHAGLAAKAGIMAAVMAEAGVTGAEETYTGPWSFEDLYSGPEAKGIDAALARLGDPSAMIEHGLWVKPWPCCASSHRPIDALIHLQRAHGFAAADVVAIEVMLSEIAYRNLKFDEPSHAIEARFSLQHPLAAVLVDGEPTIATFTDAATRRPELRAFYGRISRTSDPDLPGNRQASPGDERASVTVRLAGGACLSHTVVDPLGHPRAPLDEAALARKFIDCASGALGDRAAQRAFDALLALPQQTSAAAIMHLCMPALEGETAT